jgi:hypothetical protein
MVVYPELLVLFLSVFIALIGFIGHGIIARLASIDAELKGLLVGHGQRIATLEAKAGFLSGLKS